MRLVGAADARTKGAFAPPDPPALLVPDAYEGVQRDRPAQVLPALVAPGSSRRTALEAMRVGFAQPGGNAYQDFAHRMRDIREAVELLAAEV